MSAARPPRLTDAEIHDALGALRGWSREDDALVKTFEFARFAEGIAFVRSLAAVADEMDHHPDIDIRYTKVKLSLSTHDAGGISALDVQLATRAEALAG